MYSRKNIWLAIVVIMVFVFTVGGTIIIVSSQSGSGVLSTPSSVNIEAPIVETTTNTPTVIVSLQDLNGIWAADSGNGDTLTGIIANNEIRIMLNNEGAKMLYWVGTFDPVADPGRVVTSTKIDINKAVLSRAGSKDFSIGKNTITFDLSVMGKTTKVVMNRA